MRSSTAQVQEMIFSGLNNIYLGLFVLIVCVCILLFFVPSIVPVNFDTSYQEILEELLSKNIEETESQSLDTSESEYPSESECSSELQLESCSQQNDSKFDEKEFQINSHEDYETHLKYLEDKLDHVMEMKEDTITHLTSISESNEELIELLRLRIKSLKKHLKLKEGKDVKPIPQEQLDKVKVPPEIDYKITICKQNVELQRCKFELSQYQVKEKKQELIMQQKREKDKVRQTKQKQRENEMKEKLANLQKQTKELLQTQKKLQQQLKSANESNCVCSICYEGKIDTALSPWYL